MIMGFISYSVSFLQKRIHVYESNYSEQAPQSIVHEAKVLLKFLEDLKDEGYYKSYEFINEQTNAIKRLNSFILKNHESPFAMEKFSKKPTSNYKSQNYDFYKYLNFLKLQIKSVGCTLNRVPAVFYDILRYSQDVFNSATSNTAYCFLLRDTLLSYLAFEKWNDERKFTTYPMLIGRKYLSFFDNKNNNFDVYQKIQDIIFDALDCGFNNLSDIKFYLKKEITSNYNFKKLVNSLKSMMDRIKQESVMIVESGYIGTIPLLLSALDDRVDFRLFTTIPYFYELYKEKFFTYEFQKLRLFETIYCQNNLFKISSVDNTGNISVCATSDGFVKKQAFAELRTWNKLVSLD